MYQDRPVRLPLTIAAVQPACTARNVSVNAREHAEAIGTAQTRVVVFPELSLTGYEPNADVVSPSAGSLFPIVEACATTNSVALVGAPVPGKHGHVHIGILCVSSSGAEVVYRKTWLGPAETSRFSPGHGPKAIAVDGWRVGLGICKDTGVSEHVRRVAALGVDLYVAGLAYLPEELAEHDARAVSIARQCGAHVAFASFAGPTGGGYDRTAGASAIWSPAGSVLARAGSETGDMARTSIS